MDIVYYCTLLGIFEGEAFEEGAPIRHMGKA